jgi:hypothetical protein
MNSLFGEKLVVSMTRVSPSQCARESPFQTRMRLSRCGRLSSGMMRASCAISLMIIT